MKKHFGCPVQATTNVLSGKWKVLIVWHLSFHSYRFAMLRNLLPGVSEKVLTSQLRELQRDGVIRRKAELHRRTLYAEYSLSEAGEALIPILELMCKWGTKHLGVNPTLPPRPAVDPANIQSHSIG